MTNTLLPAWIGTAVDGCVRGSATAEDVYSASSITRSSQIMGSVAMSCLPVPENSNAITFRIGEAIAGLSCTVARTALTQFVRHGVMVN